MNWTRTDERKPDDEQTVLGYWAPNSVHAEPIYESLTYHASDSEVDGREAWLNWNSNVEDAPDAWVAIEDISPTRQGGV